MERKIRGKYIEQFADGSEKLHWGYYYINILKTRCKITFIPYGCEMPLFKDFVILGHYGKAIHYIEDNWQ